MGLEEDLARAEAKAKAGEIEKKSLSIVAKVLRVKEGVLAATLHAHNCVEKIREQLATEFPWFELATLEPEEVAGEVGHETAGLIERSARIRVLTVALQQAIVAEETIRVSIAIVLPDDRYKEICNGCPERMQCIAENLSTPEKCYEWDGHRQYVELKPLRIVKNKVIGEMPQPGGTHEIPLWKLAEPRMIRGVW